MPLKIVLAICFVIIASFTSAVFVSKNSTDKSIKKIEDKVENTIKETNTLKREIEDLEKKIPKPTPSNSPNK